LRVVLESVRHNLVKHGGRDADVGDDNLAAQQSAGQKQVAWFLAKKRDCQDGGNRPQRFTGITHQAAWNINGND
jgi:hypothetical protein